MQRYLQHWPTYAAYGLLSLALLMGTFPRAIAGLKPHEIALILLAAALVVRRVVRRDASLSGSLLDVGFGLLIIFGALVPLVVMEVRGMPITRGAVQALLSPVEWYLWYRVMLEALPMPRELPRLLAVLLVLLSVIGLVGDLQALHIPGVAQLLNVLSSTHQTAVSGDANRPTSTVGDWGLLASLCGFALLLINQLQTSRTGRPVFRSRWWRYWCVGLMVVDGAAVVFTRAVEGILALALGYTLAYLINRRFAVETRAAGVVVAFAAPILGVFVWLRLYAHLGTGSLLPQTWQVRFLHWQIVLQSIFQNAGTVVFGVNPNFLYPVSQFQGTESLYWLLWYRGGLLYLLAFLAFLACAIWTAWQRFKRTDSPLERSFLVWAWVCLIVIAAIGIIDALFVDGGEAQALFTIIAAIGGLSAARNTYRGRRYVLTTTAQ